MGGGASKPEDIARIAAEDGGFNPPLGPPSPVSYVFIKTVVRLIVEGRPASWIADLEVAFLVSEPKLLCAPGLRPTRWYILTCS